MIYFFVLEVCTVDVCSKSQAIMYRYLNTKSCQPSLLPTHSLSIHRYIHKLAYGMVYCLSPPTSTSLCVHTCPNVPLLYMNKLKPTHYITMRCHIYTFAWIIDANDNRRPPQLTVYYMCTTVQSTKSKQNPTIQYTYSKTISKIIWTYHNVNGS